MAAAVEAAVKAQSEYSYVFDGRFIGGFNTRAYGDPEHGVHAIQLELSQATHLDEKTKSWSEEKVADIRPVLQSVLRAIVKWMRER